MAYYVIHDSLCKCYSQSTSIPAMQPLILTCISPVMAASHGLVNSLVHPYSAKPVSQSDQIKGTCILLNTFHQSSICHFLLCSYPSLPKTTPTHWMFPTRMIRLKRQTDKHSRIHLRNRRRWRWITTQFSPDQNRKEQTSRVDCRWWTGGRVTWK